MRNRKTQTIRLFLLFEAASFIAASLVHAGVLITGYEHQKARIAESVIASVLLAGAALTWVRPAWTRKAGLAAQGFALLGTMVGIFTIAIGIGPDAPALENVLRAVRQAVEMTGEAIACVASMVPDNGWIPGCSFPGTSRARSK